MSSILTKMTGSLMSDNQNSPAMEFSPNQDDFQIIGSIRSLGFTCESITGNLKPDRLCISDMAPRPYFDNITSESSFERTFKSNSPTFSSLVQVGASHWKRDHLIACRVIRRTAQPNVLQIFSEYQPELSMESIPEIASFVAGPNDTSHMNLSEQHLVRDLGYGISLGQVWAALATFKGNERRRGLNLAATPSESSDSATELPSRSPRMRIKRSGLEGFRDSGKMKVGSSSSSDGSSDDTASTVEHIDAESHRLLASPEDTTVRLISCVIRHILYFIQPESLLHVTSVAEFRDEKAWLSAITNNTQRKIIAIDDGGICLRTRNGDTFQVIQKHAAILEAKRQFQCILPTGKLMISDECFAQMTCEALTARLVDLSNGISGSQR